MEHTCTPSPQTQGLIEPDRSNESNIVVELFSELFWIPVEPYNSAMQYGCRFVKLKQINFKTENIFTQVSAQGATGRFLQRAQCILSYDLNLHKISHLNSHYCTIHEASVSIFFVWFTVNAGLSFLA